MAGEVLKESGIVDCNVLIPSFGQIGSNSSQIWHLVVLFLTNLRKNVVVDLRLDFQEY